MVIFRKIRLPQALTCITIAMFNLLFYCYTSKITLCSMHGLQLHVCILLDCSTYYVQLELYLEIIRDLSIDRSSILQLGSLHEAFSVKLGLLV